MQAKMQKMQTELGLRHYEASSAGGLIKAVANGEGSLVSLKIDPSLLKDDVELLEDLIVTAVREAVDKGKADVAKEMSKMMPAGLPGLGF